MDLVQYFGDIMATKLNQNVFVMKGFIRKGIKTQYGDEALKALTPKMMIDVTQNYLATKLTKLKVNDVPGFVKTMIVEIQLNQSLFTMSNA